MDKNRLVAHRGDNTNFPENSYEALKAALKSGALFIEFDIQMNADETFIVFHDDNLSRLSKTNQSVFLLHNSDMKQFSIHNPDRFLNKHKPTYIPFLKEVLLLLGQFPKATAFVELKKESIKQWGLSRIMKKLIPQLKANSKQICLISYCYKALKYTRQHSNYKVGFVFNQMNKKAKEIAFKLQPDFLICPYKIIHNKPIWSGNWKWMVYSINDLALAKKVLQRKDVDLIETDNIQLYLPHCAK